MRRQSCHLPRGNAALYYPSGGWLAKSKMGKGIRCSDEFARDTVFQVIKPAD
jgi:hypothetical protein